MEDTFDYRAYLKNNILLKEQEETETVVDELGDEMSALIKGMDQELEKAAETEQPTNEGLLTIASIAIALPAIIGLVARVGKAGGALVNKMIGAKPTDKEAEDAWFAKLGKIADDLHHLYLVPIEKIVGKFVKDHDKAKKISNIIFHVIVASFLLASGATAVKAIQSKNISLATLEGALTAIKGGEVSTFVKSAFN